MSTHLEIDMMIAQLEAMLPHWAASYPEHRFTCKLADALEYIAMSADPNVRLHCLMRTGHLCLHSGEIPWATRYGAGRPPA